MQIFRQRRWIARWVLVWFALFLGSVWAAPLIQDEGLQLVCAGGGHMKLVDTGDDDGQLKPSARMDCPLCAALALPGSPDTGVQAWLSHRTQAHALWVDGPILSASAPPLPSRGPPSLS